MARNTLIKKVEKVKFLNVEFNLLSLSQTVKLINKLVNKSNNSINLTVVNTASIILAKKNNKMLKAINNSDIVTIDSKPIYVIFRLLNYKVPDRVCGPDLFLKLIKLSAKEGYRPYFLGATENVVEKMVKVFKKNYPSLEIAGYRNGYFSEDEEENIAQAIKESHADMLFLGIPSPKKEIFIDKYTQMMDVPFTMGVGGSFDIVAGKTQRAPLWMQKYCLEWFYRILQEPRRLWKRYAYTNTLFIGLVIKEMFKRIFSNTS